MLQDWEVSNLLPAINNNRVLLLQNLVTGLHSDDLAVRTFSFYHITRTILQSRFSFTYPCDLKYISFFANLHMLTSGSNN